MNLWTSITRTLVPAVVGWIVAGLALVGITVPTSERDWIAGGVTFAAAGIWYVGVRALEARWPKLGVLLGVPAKPVYQAVGTDADPVAAPEDPDADVKAAAA